MRNKSVKAFTLLELIFVIVIISALASIALPKFFNAKTLADVAVLKQDIVSTISSLQSYSLSTGSVSKISDVITLNETLWTVEDKKISFTDGDSTCLSIEIKNTSLTKEIVLLITPSVSILCTKLNEEGIVSRNYPLY